MRCSKSWVSKSSHLQPMSRTQTSLHGSSLLRWSLVQPTKMVKILLPIHMAKILQPSQMVKI